MEFPRLTRFRKSVAVAAKAMPFKHLQPGHRYHVIRPFFDFDCLGHPVGENWRFLNAQFLPHEDGLSLLVEADGAPQRQIRLQWRPEAQAEVIDALETYLSSTPAKRELITLRLTRDSVALGDDIDTPHAMMLAFDPGADAVAVAETVLAANYPAHVAGNATWWLDLAGDRVVFGFRDRRPFFLPVAPEPHRARAARTDCVHVFYAAQQDPLVLAQALALQPDGSF